MAAVTNQTVMTCR